MKTNTQFTNKDEYLTYCANWKIQYKQLSKQIRDMKKAVRASYHQITWSEFSELAKMKARATAMIEERIESKVEAQRQYLAAHSMEMVAA